MSRTVIGYEAISTSDSSTESTLTPPNKTNYNGISARVQVAAGNGHSNQDKACRYAFTSGVLLGADGGMSLGDKDYLELENLSQIEDFRFTTNENTQAVALRVVYFNDNY